LNVLTPEKLADRLEKTMSFIDSTEEAERGQRTLTATIDWSWRLLGSDEQALLRRLSVFPGGASLEAVEAVCVGGVLTESGVIDSLSRLLEKSLITYIERGGDPRYRLLDAVRSFAGDRLDDAGERTELTTRFITWVGDFAQEVAAADESPDYPVWLVRADTEMDNVIAALNLAATRNDAVELSRITLRPQRAARRPRPWGGHDRPVPGVHGQAW
jgi:predicted ATPase